MPNIMLRTVVVEVFVDAMVMNMQTTKIMKTPIPSTLLMVMLTVMSMIIVVRLMLIVNWVIGRVALPLPPGIGVYLSACSKEFGF